MFDVITIGTATRDVFLQSPLFRAVVDSHHLKQLGLAGEEQCFALGSKIEIEKPVMTVGGGAANAAVTFARQGFVTGAVFKIGDDYVGTQAVAALKREGIKTVPITDVKKGTAWSCILLSPSGERTILNYRGASEDITKNDIAKAHLKTRAAFFVPGRIPFSVLAPLVRSLNEQKAVLVMTPSSYYLGLGAKKLAPMLKALDIVVMNREEAAFLTGIPRHNEAAIFKKLDALVEGIAVMTDGKNGVMVSDGKNLFHAGVYRGKKVVDRTGAGDAFASGFLASLLSRVKPADIKKRTIAMTEYVRAMQFASANATSVVEHIGAEPGILKKGEFEKQNRWRRLVIKHRTIL